MMSLGCSGRYMDDDLFANSLKEAIELYLESVGDDYTISPDTEIVEIA